MLWGPGGCGVAPGAGEAKGLGHPGDRGQGWGFQLWEVGVRVQGLPGQGLPHGTQGYRPREKVPESVDCLSRLLPPSIQVGHAVGLAGGAGMPASGTWGQGMGAGLVPDP